MSIEKAVDRLKELHSKTFKAFIKEGKTPNYTELYKGSIALNAAALEELNKQLEQLKEIEPLKKEVLHFREMAENYEKIIQQQQDQINVMKG